MGNCCRALDAQHPVICPLGGDTGRLEARNRRGCRLYARWIGLHHPVADKRIVRMVYDSLGLGDFRPRVSDRIPVLAQLEAEKELIVDSRLRGNDIWSKPPSSSSTI